MPNSISHFIYQYKGNKRQETSTILPIINFNNKKNIVEPFCGTSAMSFTIWKKYGNQFNYYLNDIDEKLIEVYNLYKNLSIEEIEENIRKIQKEYNNLNPDVKTKGNRYKKVANEAQISYMKENRNKSVYHFIFFNRYCLFGIMPPALHCGFLIEFKLKPIQREFIEFINQPNVFITNNDYKIIYEEHKNNSKSIILLDPPYVNTSKQFYQSNDTEIYSYFSNNPIKKNKASIYVIVDDNWIMRIIFRDYNILSVYDKKYINCVRHRKVNHIIFSNRSSSDEVV